MAAIPTVRGEIDSSELGVTLVHEHLCFRAPSKWQQRAMDYAVKLAQDAVDVGVNTLVDVSPVPDVAKVIELCERVPDLNVILATGAYLEGAAWTGSVGDLTEDEMFAHMVGNLTDGYRAPGHTGIRAGVIKVASAGPQLTEWEMKNFRAAARAQQRCHVPICFHSCAGCRTQMEYVREHGATIEATYYSHIEAEFGWEGRSLEEEAAYLADVCAAGGYLQFNNFDFEFDTPFSDMLSLVNTLGQTGHGDRILYSIDANWEFDEDGRPWHEAERKHPETGKRTYAYAITHATPMLMSAGVSLQRINRYLVENPRRLFETFDGG
jgi:phosphotriesterase-related protein